MRRNRGKTLSIKKPGVYLKISEVLNENPAAS